MSLLENQGWQILRQAISPKLQQEFLSEYQRLLELGDGKSQNIRRVGMKSPLIADFSHSAAIQKMLPANMIPVRIIFFNKNEVQNWPVPPHQDLTIAVKQKNDLVGFGPWSMKEGVCHVQPPLELLQGMITLRLHVDACAEQGGALQVRSGTHLHGLIPSEELAGFQREKQLCPDIEAGDVLLMKPLIIHSSRRSEVPQNQRRILHIEFAPASALPPKLEWAE